MYGINETTESTKPNGGAIPPGIHENCKVVDVSFSSLKDDSDPVLNFTVQDSEGNQLREVIWPVNPSQVTAGLATNPRKHPRNVASKGYVKDKFITPEQAVAMAFDDFNARCKHIIGAITGSEEFTINASSYADFANKFIAYVTPFLDNPLRIKVVLNSSDYSSFPRYGYFIEPMSVEKTRLSFGRRDKIEPDAKPDEQQPTTSAALPPGGAATLPPTVRPATPPTLASMQASAAPVAAPAAIQSDVTTDEDPGFPTS